MSLLSLADLGLVIIAFAWLVQLYQVVRVNKNISPLFVFGYMLGVGMLVVSAWVGNVSVSYFELATFLAATLVLVFILRNK